MSRSFPLAFMVNTFAMTALLIIIGIAGNPALAADIGIVQGATLALFYAFSANARSLILSKSAVVSAHSILIGRLLLLIPLSAICYWLSVHIAGVEQSLAVALILRRVVEWLGEVHLSEAERLQDHRSVRLYLIIQSTLLLIAVSWLLGNLPFPLLGIFAWALLPLFFSAKFIVQIILKIPQKSAGIVFKILPHLGSTAIIGITVYVFRLLILMLMGKEGAGDLYTAFAIGGITGSVFANALGASIALHEQRIGKRYFPTKLRQGLTISLVLGLLISISAIFQLPFLEISGKSYFFWQATGFSLIGGVIMVFAQRIRFRILQSDEEKDVFGPDVMMNILLIAAIPFAFYLVGRESMAALYLFSAVLAYIFYSSAIGEGGLKQLSELAKVKLRKALAIALLFPIFFQAGSGIFRDPSPVFNSQGKLAQLPIPLSVFACFVGIVLLGNYRRAFISYLIIFLSCVLMIMSTVVSTSSNLDLQEAKLILLVQYILPMFALALGQAYFAEDDTNGFIHVSKAFLTVLLIIVPLQLSSTWAQGYSFLAASVGLFSIYQQLQYVPVIFVSAYVIALFTLWHLSNWRMALLILLPLMSVYVVVSISMLAIGLFYIGLLLFGIYRWVLERDKLALVALCLTGAVSMSYGQYEKDKLGWKLNVLDSKTEIVPKNISSRVDYWRYYLTEVTSDSKAFLVGQSVTPDRTEYPSAHNYYLDFAYNFGFLALLPILTLLSITCVLVYRRRNDIHMSSGLIGLSMVVLFLLFVDNSLKVGLRQPYPGIFTYFLWGILLSRLLDLDAEGKLNET